MNKLILAAILAIGCITPAFGETNAEFIKRHEAEMAKLDAQAKAWEQKLLDVTTQYERNKGTPVVACSYIRDFNLRMACLTRRD